MNRTYLNIENRKIFKIYSFDQLKKTKVTHHPSFISPNPRCITQYQTQIWIRPISTVNTWTHSHQNKEVTEDSPAKVELFPNISAENELPTYKHIHTPYF